MSNSDVNAATREAKRVLLEQAAQKQKATTEIAEALAKESAGLKEVNAALLKEIAELKQAAEPRKAKKWGATA